MDCERWWSSLWKRTELLTLVILFISPHYSKFTNLDMQWGAPALSFLSETRQATVISYHSHWWWSFWISPPHRNPRPRSTSIRWSLGDILAGYTVYSCRPEFHEGLFGLKGDGGMVGSIRKFDSKDEEEVRICELMDLAVGKLCLPLKVCISPPYFVLSFFLCSFVVLDEV